MAHECTYVFVYGSLLAGMRNDRHLHRSRRVGGRASLAGLKLYDLGPFPGARISPGNVTVGELHVVDRDTLASLDCLEGYPDFYTRRRMTAIVTDPDGQSKSFPCWVYVLASPPGNRESVAGNDWRRHVREREAGR